MRKTECEEWEIFHTVFPIRGKFMSFFNARTIAGCSYLSRLSRLGEKKPLLNGREEYGMMEMILVLLHHKSPAHWIAEMNFEGCSLQQLRPCAASVNYDVNMSQKRANINLVILFQRTFFSSWPFPFKFFWVNLFVFTYFKRVIEVWL